MDHLADAPIANILILAGVIFLAVGLFGRVGGFIGSIFGNIEAGKNSRVLAGVLGACLIVGGGWLHEDSHKQATSATPPASPAATTPASSAPASSGPASTTSSATAPAQSLAPSVPSEPSKGKASRSTPERTTASTSTADPPLAKAADREKLPTENATPAVDDHLVGTWNSLTSHPDTDLKRIEIVQVGQGLDAHVWHYCSSGECDYGIHRLAISGTLPAYDFTRGNRRYVGTLNLYTSGVVLLSIDISEPGTLNRWHHNRVLAKSTLSEKMQGAFARYLAAPNQKAFAMTPAGAWSDQFKASSADEAAQKALQRCQGYGKPGCRVILLNNDAAE